MTADKRYFKAMGRLCWVGLKDRTVIDALRWGYKEGTCSLSGPVELDSVEIEWATYPFYPSLRGKKWLPSGTILPSIIVRHRTTQHERETL